MVVVACPLAWIAKERNQSRYERYVSEVLIHRGFKRVVFGGPYDSVELLDQGQSQGWWQSGARQILGERIRELGDPPHDFDEPSRLSRLKSLASLDLGNTKVNDVQSLAKLSHLKHLWINSTEVCDVSPLSRLKHLEILELSFTKVSDLSPLSELTALRVLNLEYTPVSDLSPIVNFTELHELYIYRTHIQDLTPLVGMKHLDALNVTGLPVTREQVEVLQRSLPDCKIERILR